MYVLLFRIPCSLSLYITSLPSPSLWKCRHDWGVAELHFEPDLLHGFFSRSSVLLRSFGLELPELLLMFA